MTALRAWRVLLSAVAVFAAAACGGGSTGPAVSAAAPPSATVTSGTQSLAFTAKTLDGQDFAGSSLAGKPVVLWFWAPWCPKCRAAAPDVAKTAQQITVVGVPGLSDDRASMRDFVSSTKTGGFTHLGDGAAEVWKRFGITTQHTYVLIGSDGAVVYKGALDASGLARRVAALA